MISSIKLFVLKRAIRRIRSKADYKDIPRARHGFERISRVRGISMKGVNSEPFLINHMKCEWQVPEICNKDKVLLYFHGGAYVVGSIGTHRHLCANLSWNAGVKGLIIDYRLAPENKYPSAVEDAVMAYKWLLEQGYKSEDIAFGGDSAGGGLTICTLLWLRDNNIPLPQCAIALSPWLDLTGASESMVTRKHLDCMLLPEAMPFMASQVMGDQPLDVPYASPVFAKDFLGLPPIYIQVGDEEIILNDSTRFTEKVKAAGGDIQLEIYPGMFHVFQAFWKLLPQSRKANAKFGEFLKKQLKA